MKIEYFPEERLLFGNDCRKFDSRAGLLAGGPFSSTETGEKEELVIKCGVVGSKSIISKFRKYLEVISNGLLPTSSVYGKYGFPSLNKPSMIAFSFIIPDYLQSPITLDEIRNVVRERGNMAKNRLISLIDEKLRSITMSERIPDIVFVCLDNQLLSHFQRAGIELNDIIFSNRNVRNEVFNAEGDIDFHSIVKILGMKYNITTQLVKEDTINFNAPEDRVTTAWNLAVGTYYKANGIPWKFSKFDDGIMYVGINFFRDFTDDEVSMSSSMAQVFISTGENYILRGEPFRWTPSRKEKSPHLKHDQAKDITKKIMDMYRLKRGRYPDEVIFHKSSSYEKDELDGFCDHPNLQSPSFLTIYTRSPGCGIDLYRTNSIYPVMRGTALLSANDSHAILYTNGYIPVLKTYIGMRIPRPIEVRSFTEGADIREACQDILKLTRLDWNNVKYCDSLPMTLVFAERVGKILSERRAASIPIKDHYRFYM